MFCLQFLIWLPPVGGGDGEVGGGGGPHLLPPASPWWNFPHNNSPASQQIALLCLLYLSWTTNKNPNTICLSWTINSCQALSSRETFSTSLVFCSDHWLFDLFTLNLLSISYCERGGRPVTCWNRILCDQITTTDHPPLNLMHPIINLNLNLNLSRSRPPTTLPLSFDTPDHHFEFDLNLTFKFM